MTPFRCAICGEIHDGLPAYGYLLPDPWLALSEAERAQGKVDSDLCRTPHGEFFVRATLTLPLIGGPEPSFEFGVWGSLSEASFERYANTFSDSDQSKLGVLFSYVSNELKGFPASFALPADLLPQDNNQRPKLLLHGGDHPLIQAQSDGVAFEKVLAIIHES